MGTIVPPVKVAKQGKTFTLAFIIRIFVVINYTPHSKDTCYNNDPAPTPPLLAQLCTEEGSTSTTSK